MLGGPAGQSKEPGHHGHYEQQQEKYQPSEDDIPF
jgi:hypothetical protein